MSRKDKEFVSVTIAEKDHLTKEDLLKEKIFELEMACKDYDIKCKFAEKEKESILQNNVFSSFLV
jgi:hypothetical protein